MSLCCHVHKQCFCLCVSVRLSMQVCMCTCLKCAAAKSDRTQAHISLPRERYKGTHTYRPCLLSLSLSLKPYLSNSVSSNSFCLKLCLHTHIHRHTCSPRSAKRERWLVNKQWHSAHSVTRLGFDQHRCSCSPQQCFLSFCLLNAAVRVHMCTHIQTHIFNILFMSQSYTETCIRLYGPTYTLSFSPIFSSLSLYLYLYVPQTCTHSFELVPLSTSFSVVAFSNIHPHTV